MVSIRSAPGSVRATRSARPVSVELSAIKIRYFVGTTEPTGFPRHRISTSGRSRVQTTTVSSGPVLEHRRASPPRLVLAAVS